jgi:hypothetical protein
MTNGVMVWLIQGFHGTSDDNVQGEIPYQILSIHHSNKENMDFTD